MAVRIHGIGAVTGDLGGFPIQSHDPVRVKGAGRGRECDETDATPGDGLFVIADLAAVGKAVAEINVIS